MGKVNLQTELKDLEGNKINAVKEYAIFDQNSGEFLYEEDGSLAVRNLQDPGRGITVGDVIKQSLTSTAPENDKEKSQKDFEIAVSIQFSDGTIELESDEISRIKELVNKMVSNKLIAGQVFNVLEEREPFEIRNKK